MGVRETAATFSSFSLVSEEEILDIYYGLYVYTYARAIATLSSAELVFIYAGEIMCATSNYNLLAERTYVGISRRV